eukprot:m.231581 g.231581  ORF g.231581 m.231581 type:complete len:69 (+) comp17066_c0_seq1:5045-5251(+)
MCMFALHPCVLVHFRPLYTVIMSDCVVDFTGVFVFSFADTDTICADSTFADAQRNSAGCIATVKHANL